MTAFEVVRTDQFDRGSLEEMRAASRQLNSALDGITDATPRGEDLGPDLWSSLVRVAPRKTEDRVPPAHRVNEAVIDSIWGSDGYRNLHRMTMGDPVAAAAGVVSLSRKVSGLLEGLGDVAEQAERAQQAQDDLEEAMGEGGTGVPRGTGDDPEPDLDIEALRSKAEEESELLDAMVDEKMPKIESAVRAGVEAAEAEADGHAVAAAGWDLSPGEAESMDPKKRIRLMMALSQERMQRIADLVGLMENLAMGNRDRRYELHPGMITGVTLGRHLADLTDSEFAALALPELEDLMILRVVKGRARVYLTEVIERAGRGAIIYLEDQSGSMLGPKGDWSKAFGLALLRAARSQGRAFHAFCFQGPGKWRRFDFPEPNAPVTELMIEFASTQPDGGTEVTGPIDEAVSLLQAEYDNAGRIEGDLIIGTDGEVGISDEWLEGFIARRTALEFNMYGLAIRARLSTLHKLCTHVADITDLTSGRDVADIFATVHDH